MSTNTQSSTRDLTEGNVFRTLVVFSVPFMGANILQTLYSMVDMMIVGNIVGSAGLSALSVGSQLMEMMLVMLIGFTNGGQVVISQHIGSGRRENVPRINGTLTVLTLLLAVAFSIVGIIGCDFFLGLLNTPEEALAYAQDYVTIYSSGLIFTGLYNMIAAIFRAQGDSRHPLIFVMIATCLNVILDLLFVGVFGWAAAGAAAATVIGQAVSVVCSVTFLIRHQNEFNYYFRRNLFRPDGKIAATICKLGVPMALQSSAINISFLFVSGMINTLGVAASAAFGAMQKIRNLPGFIMQSFSLGGNAMVGQNYGAGRYDRIRQVYRSCLVISAAIAAFSAVIMLCFPKMVFHLFTSDEAVLSYAFMCMLCLVIELPAKVAMTGGNAVIAGIGIVKLSMPLAIIDAILGRIGFTYFFGKILGLGAFGYFLGYTSATYITASVQLVYYLSGAWTRRRRDI